MHKLSIIIPTRDRLTTLKYTLQQVLGLPSANLEIIVSNNASTDETKSYLSEVDDPRLTVVNLERRVNMLENFDIGASHATGDYIMFLGDDDMIVEQNLVIIRDLLDRRYVDLLYWTRGAFFWSDVPGDEAGKIYINKGNLVQTVDTGYLLSSVYNCSLPWTFLPSIYNSIISRRSINQYRKYFDGKVYLKGSGSIDVATSLTFSDFFSAAQFFEGQVSVSGISNNSSGFSVEFNSEQHHKMVAEMSSEPIALAQDEISKYVLDGTAYAKSQYGPLQDFVNFHDRTQSEFAHRISKNDFLTLFFYKLYKTNHIIPTDYLLTFDEHRVATDYLWCESASILKNFYDHFHIRHPVRIVGRLRELQVNPITLHSVLKTIALHE